MLDLAAVTLAKLWYSRTQMGSLVRTSVYKLANWPAMDSESAMLRKRNDPMEKELSCPHPM